MMMKKMKKTQRSKAQDNTPLTKGSDTEEKGKKAIDNKRNDNHKTKHPAAANIQFSKRSI